MGDNLNILFINTDQQTWNVVSAYGNPHVHTPHIDRLQKNGISFMNSYCADPVCGPARTSWVSGLYTSENGVPFNGGRMHEDIPDLGQVLTRNGYHAIHCGKWHVEDRKMRDSFHNLYTGKRDIGACGGEYYDRVSTHAVIDFLDRYDQTTPFYLQVGLVNPHDICEYLHNHEHKTIPGPIEQGLLAVEDLPPLPANFEYDEREIILQKMLHRDKVTSIHAPILNGIGDWTEDQWRFLTWNHHRFVEAADQQIGLILNALENSRFKNNTLIIFTADHGESSGCHRSFQKFSLYEESIRVPFIIADLNDQLNIPKNVLDTEHFVSGVDLVPTVLDYAGIEVPEGVQGLSLKPLIEMGCRNAMCEVNVGEKDESKAAQVIAWRDFAYVESNFWGRAIITERFKYIMEYRPKEEEDFVPPGPDTNAVGLEQLFDLVEDPWEIKNLAGESDYGSVIEECRKKLFSFERRLHRRPLREGRLRDYTQRLSGQLHERWAAYDG
jgi:arylsulfatase A-like enzyme